MSKVLIAQGGGPTAVINQSLVGAVIQSRGAEAVDAVYGAMHGVRGIVDEDFIDLTREPRGTLERVAETPGSALGSTRDKPDEAYCKAILEVLRAHGITVFFYIGGNDSSDTLGILSAQAAKAGFDLACIHIPKTIDNDLMVNDHTPGYPSAARFVANAFAGINRDNAALPGVYVGVVMGRHAGFLTAASSALRTGDDGPHLIYLPERAFDMDGFVGDVKATYDRLGRCMVAVSEGIQDDAGEPIAAKLAQELEKDAHGNVTLSGTGALADLLTGAIKESTGISRVRGDTFGYLQRSFLGCVSDVDRGEARAVGVEAARFAESGNREGSVTIHRTADYQVEYRLSPLEEVAGKTKVMDDAFIADSGTDVTDAFADYLRPLLGSQIPVLAGFGPKRVAKILNK